MSLENFVRSISQIAAIANAIPDYDPSAGEIHELKLEVKRLRATIAKLRKEAISAATKKHEETK